MKYFRYMWVGSSLDDSRKTLFKQMKKGKLPEDVYLLCLPRTTEYLMDIYPGKTVNQKCYKKSDQIVIGCAGSYDEACELAGSIIRTVYVKTGQFDLKAYLDDALKEAHHA